MGGSHLGHNSSSPVTTSTTRPCNMPRPLRLLASRQGAMCNSEAIDANIEAIDVQDKEDEGRMYKHVKTLALMARTSEDKLN
jgi:hypothetical protein